MWNSRRTLVACGLPLFSLAFGLSPAHGADAKSAGAASQVRELAEQFRQKIVANTKASVAKVTAAHGYRVGLLLGGRAITGKAAIRSEGKEYTTSMHSSAARVAAGLSAVGQEQEWTNYVAPEGTPAEKIVPRHEIRSGAGSGIGVVRQGQGGLGFGTNSIVFSKSDASGVDLEFLSVELRRNKVGPLGSPRIVRSILVGRAAENLANRALEAYERGDLAAPQLALPRLQRAMRLIEENEDSWNVPVSHQLSTP
jgi:hypothetical protein